MSYFVVLLHLFNISRILESLVSFLVVFMLQMLDSFPQIFNHLQLRLTVLDELLQVLQSGDDFLHERGDLLSSMVVDEMLELLESQHDRDHLHLPHSPHLADIGRDIINIHQVESLLLGVRPADSPRSPVRSLHTRLITESSHFISETRGNNIELYQPVNLN